MSQDPINTAKTRSAASAAYMNDHAPHPAGSLIRTAFEHGWGARDWEVKQLIEDVRNLRDLNLTYEHADFERGGRSSDPRVNEIFSENKRIKEAAWNLLNALPDRVLSDNAKETVALQRALAERDLAISILAQFEVEKKE